MKYKLKKEITQFIVDKKNQDRKISCRGLVLVIKEKFSIELSKSSINAIIKENNLSSPVGRRRTRPKKADTFKMPPVALPVMENNVLFTAKELVIGTSSQKPKEDILEAASKQQGLVLPESKPAKDNQIIKDELDNKTAKTDSFNESRRSLESLSPEINASQEVTEKNNTINKCPNLEDLKDKKEVIHIEQEQKQALSENISQADSVEKKAVKEPVPETMFKKEGVKEVVSNDKPINNNDLEQKSQYPKFKDGGWSEPVFEVHKDLKPQAGLDLPKDKEELNKESAKIVYPKYIRDGGCYFMKVADFKSGLILTLSEKLEGYMPELELGQRQAFLEKLIYGPLFKDPLSLRVFMGRDISGDLIKKYTAELNQSAFLSIKDDLIRLKLYSNINGINDLIKGCLNWLNSYAQERFFPNIYQYLDVYSMHDRFYNLFAKYEEWGNIVKISLYYTSESTWSSDIIWLEDIASAAKAVNDAQITSPKGQQIWFNPAIELLT